MTGRKGKFQKNRTLFTLERSTSILTLSYHIIIRKGKKRKGKEKGGRKEGRREGRCLGREEGSVLEQSSQCRAPEPRAQNQVSGGQHGSF